MSKYFKIKVEDTRPEAEEMKKAWKKVSGRNIEDSTIFHQFTVTDVETQDEALVEVLNVIEKEAQNMKIVYVEEFHG